MAFSEYEFDYLHTIPEKHQLEIVITSKQKTNKKGGKNHLTDDRERSGEVL